MLEVNPSILFNLIYAIKINQIGNQNSRFEFLDRGAGHGQFSVHDLFLMESVNTFFSALLPKYHSFLSFLKEKS